MHFNTWKRPLDCDWTGSSGSNFEGDNVRHAEGEQEVVKENTTSKSALISPNQNRERQLPIKPPEAGGLGGKKKQNKKIAPVNFSMYIDTTFSSLKKKKKKEKGGVWGLT